MGHRLSGIALALFLPVHFLLLGSAFDGASGLDRYLAFADNPLVKIAEWGLVVMLAVHFFFGIRVLLLELTRWPGHERRWSSWVIPSVVAAAFVGIIFLFQATA